MNRLVLVALGTIAAVSGGVTLGQTDKTKTMEPIIVEDDYLVFFDHQPEGYFSRAHADFLEGFRWSCANQLRRASAQLRIEAERSNREQDVQALRNAGDSLDWLADDVEDGNVYSVERLDHAFARTDRVLADHRMKLTTEAWKDDRRVSTGRNLTSTINSLEDALAWSGNELSDAGTSSVVYGVDVAGKLVLGSTVQDADVKKAIDQVGVQIKSLDDIIHTAAWGVEPVIRYDTYPDLDNTETWLVFMDEPTLAFNDAQRDMLMRQYQAAAHDVYRGAAFLRLKASGASGSVERNLVDNADQLDVLADNITVKDKRPTVQTLRCAFGRAHLALAKYYRAMASKSEEQELYRETGRYLQAAATQLERAAVWTGNTMESSAHTIVLGTRTLAAELIDGVGWTAEKLAKGMQALDRQIDDVGRMMMPPKQTAARSSY